MRRGRLRAAAAASGRQSGALGRNRAGDGGSRLRLPRPGAARGVSEPILGGFVMNRVFCALAMTTALWVAGAAMAAEKSVTLAIKGMYCSACPYIVKQSLVKIRGVENVAVSYEKQTATVSFDD